MAHLPKLPHLHFGNFSFWWFTQRPTKIRTLPLIRTWEVDKDQNFAKNGRDVWLLRPVAWLTAILHWSLGDCLGDWVMDSSLHG